MLSVFKSEILTPIRSVSSLFYNGIFAKDKSAILIMNARRDSNRKSQGKKINVGNGLKKKKLYRSGAQVSRDLAVVRNVEPFA